MDLKVAALAGGVGGAKLVDGLAKIIPTGSLTVIVNTGDDFDHFGLRICPDLDTVCYTLGGLANQKTGWGRADETWKVLENLEQLGAPAWFRLGDSDLATHLERTRLLKSGKPLSEITRNFCNSWGFNTAVLPMSDDPIATIVETDQGELAFQDYFVRLGCQPQVSGFRFEGVESAVPAPGVIDAISEADVVIICPSNPWVSIDPILSIPGVREVMMEMSRSQKVIAVSPIIAGQAVKGPAAKMYREMGITPSALNVANHYGNQTDGGLLTGFVCDELDADQQHSIVLLGMKIKLTNTLMTSLDDRIRLATEIIGFVETQNDG